MLANFFNKSKPITFIVITAIFLVYLLINVFNGYSNDISFGNYTLETFKMLFLFLVYFSIYIFILLKNNLTSDNSFAFLFLVILIGLFPYSLSINNLFYANLILLLFYRKLYSLQSPKNTFKKLYDAGFWLGILFLIEPFTLLFALLLYGVIFLYQKTAIQTLLIPIIGFLTPLFLFFTYCFWYEKTEKFTQLFYWTTSYDFSVYTTSKFIFSTLFIGFLTLVSIIFKTPKALGVINSFKPTWKLILLHMAIVILLFLFINKRIGNEFFFLFFPISIILTNGIELLHKKWMVDIILVTFFITSLAINFM